MPRTYTLKRIEGSPADWREAAPPLAVDTFPWAGPDGFRPRTTAQAAIDGNTSLCIYMETAETELRAETSGFGHVHTDSCMEFFLSPDPLNTPRYFNWEFNPAGAMYLAIGTSRRDRTPLPEKNYRELFAVQTTVHGRGWSLELRIPLSFLRRFFPALTFAPGYTMRGNFYKCGDNTRRPHFGCWSPIDLPEPDFHCPDFFGTLRTGTDGE
jgi:hypothetical protein